MQPGTKVAGEVINFPGGYKVGTKILALMANGEDWKVAEIYAVRHAKLFDENMFDEDSVDPNSAKKKYGEQFLKEVKASRNPEEASKGDEEIKKAMRYEYYIHFHGVDRRSDRWTTEHFLQVNDEANERQLAEIET